ncbi:hypothetical protein Tco_0953099 [Tanacetum coccineum]|uniref:Uncharacterized protein n=1 Tax=Tanacetum coccineum TaxID=301880 RepID=A0ABQ5E3T7_9ASTR
MVLTRLVPKHTCESQVSIVYDKHALWGISYRGRKRQQFYGYAVNRESSRDVYSRRQQSYAIHESFRLRTHNNTNISRLDQSLQEMTTSCTHSKKAITTDFAFKTSKYIASSSSRRKRNKSLIYRANAIFLGVSLRMFTRSIVIKRRVEYLQLGIKSYQKKLNLTKSDTYRSDLKRKTAYTAYSNPRGFIYQNQYKKNRLMRIDELHKFSDGTLNDVWSALDDTLKRIWMKCLPQTIWREVYRKRAGAMIQAIDQQLRNRRIIRCLEEFVGGRLYEGYLQLLERTI